MGKTSPFPLKAINESGTTTIDVQLLQVPDSAITEQSGTVSLASSTGDVTGPSSATDNAIVRFDSTTGKLVQNSAGFVSDNGIIYTGTTLATGYTDNSASVVGNQLTVASTGIQRFTASAAGNDVQLPVVSTLPQVGTAYLFINDTTGNIIVQSSGSNTITTLYPGQRGLFVNNALTGTGASVWSFWQVAAVSGGIPYAPNFTSGLTSTVTAAGTTVLTVTSNRTQVFTGSSTQTVTLPVVSTLPQAGHSYTIINNSDSGAITVNSSGGNLVQTIPIGCRAVVTNNAVTGTTASVWDVEFTPAASNAGAVSLTNATLTTPNVGTTLTMADAANIVVNATTGTKIGTATSQKLALWNATPIIQPASADQAALSLDVDVTGADTVDKAAINTNFTAIQTLVNQLRTDLIAAGVIKGSA